MLERIFDGAFVNSIINAPECVNGAFCGHGPQDVSPFVADPENYCLFDKTGGFIFLKEGPNTYEGHTQFLKAGRGPRVLEALKEALGYMFTTVGAVRLLGWVPDNNTLARRLNAKAGLRPVGPLDVLNVQGTMYEITKDMWIKQCHS